MIGIREVRHFCRCIIIIVFLPWTTLCQVKFTAETSQVQVEANTPFLLIYKIIDGQSDELELPQVKDLTIQKRPNVETSVTIINGKKSGYVKYTYQVVVSKEGKFILPPARAKIDGKWLQSNSLTIEVGKPVVRNYDSKGRDVFFKAILDKTKVYVGQQTLLDYEIFTNKDVINVEFEKLPQFQHIFVKPIERQNAGKNVIINNQRYYTQVVESFVLYPQKSGRQKLDRINIIYKYDVNTGSNPFFNEVKAEKHATNDLELEVAELPDNNVPGTFSGAVGEFSFSNKLSRQTISTEEILKIEMKIKGDGDPKFWNAPKLESIKGIEFFEPNLLSEETVIENGKEIHTKVYEYLAEVKKGGEFILYPKFSFFSPQNNRYITLEDKPLTINVLQGSKNNVNRQKEEDKDSSEEHSAEKKYYWPLLFLLLMTISGLSYWVFSKRKKQKNDIDAKINAKRIADQCLVRAKSFLDAGENRMFFEEISHALTRYLKFKMNIENEELDKNTLLNKLTVLDVPDSLVSSFDKMYSLCEISLFGGQSPDTKDVFNETLNIISSLEELFSRRKNV